MGTSTNRYSHKEVDVGLGGQKNNGYLKALLSVDRHRGTQGHPQMYRRMEGEYLDRGTERLDRDHLLLPEAPKSPGCWPSVQPRPTNTRPLHLQGAL